MPEEGMVEDGKLKIHQSSYACYFEDFLKYVDYNELMPEIMKAQVMKMVTESIMETLEVENEEFKQFEQEMEILKLQFSFYIDKNRFLTIWRRFHSVFIKFSDLFLLYRFPLRTNRSI